MSTLSDRINDLIGDRSVNGCAQAWGVNNSGLRKYLDGTIPRADFLIQIAKREGVSLDWLAGREGARREYASAGGDAPAAARIPAAGGNGALSAVEIAVYAGASRPLNYLTFRADYLRGRLQIDPAELLLVPVDTDDAAPALKSGGVCICHARAALEAGGLWAVELNSAVTYRRLFATASGVAIYRPDSTPGAAPLETIPAKAARRRAIGKVVWGGGEIL